MARRIRSPLAVSWPPDRLPCGPPRHLVFDLGHDATAIIATRHRLACRTSQRLPTGWIPQQVDARVGKSAGPVAQGDLDAVAEFQALRADDGGNHRFAVGGGLENLDPGAASGQDGTANDRRPL